MPLDAVLTAVLLLAAPIIGQTTSPAASITQGTTPTITAVSDCHPHGTTQFGFPRLYTTEGILISADIVWWVRPSTKSSGLPGPKIWNLDTQTAIPTAAKREWPAILISPIVDLAGRYCVNSGGDDVQILVEERPSEEETTTTEDPASHGEHCHSHAGVE
jgi:zinc transporter 1/2/3